MSLTLKLKKHIKEVIKESVRNKYKEIFLDITLELSTELLKFIAKESFKESFNVEELKLTKVIFLKDYDSKIDFSCFAHLKVLVIKTEEHISEVDLETFTGIESLEEFKIEKIKNDKTAIIRNFDFLSSFKQIESLNLKGFNKIVLDTTEKFKVMETLTNLSIEDTSMTSAINLKAFSFLKCLELSNFYDKDLLCLLDLKALSQLVLISPIRITSLFPLEQLEKLTCLSIGNPSASLRRIVLPKIKCLSHLYLSGEMIILVDVQQLSEIEIFTLTNTKVVNLDVTNLVKLHTLNLSYNALQNISFGNHPECVFISVAFNQLVEEIKINRNNFKKLSKLLTTESCLNRAAE